MKTGAGQKSGYRMRPGTSMRSASLTPSPQAISHPNITNHACIEHGHSLQKLTTPTPKRNAAADDLDCSAKLKYSNARRDYYPSQSLRLLNYSQNLYFNESCKCRSVELVLVI